MSSLGGQGDGNRMSNFPASMGPGAQPLQPGEGPGGLLQEISEIRSQYNIHVEQEAVNLDYNLNGQHRSYRIPFDSMPVSGMTRGLCWGGPNTAKVSGILLIDMVRACENITGRQIRQEEAEGIAFYTSRKMMTMYVGQVAALATGYIHAWRGRADMKFPFIKPKPIEKYDVFPLQNLPLLRGNYARYMWHITRGNIYVGMWLFLLNPLFRSVADTRMTVGLYRDPRTHDLTESVKGRIDRLRSNRASEAAGGLKNKGQPQPQQKTQAQDDNSPQSFYDNQSYGSQNDYAGDSAFTDGTTDTGLLSDKNMQQRQVQQTSPNSWSNAQSRMSRSTPAQSQPEQSQQSDFFVDDASPTAGNDPNMATPQTYERRTSGSAWDRLRGVSSQQTSSQPSNRSFGRSNTDQNSSYDTKGDSFSFSKDDADRQLAKEQAQREFDAMLERERQEAGSNDYARGMRATEAGQESANKTESAWPRRR